MGINIGLHVFTKNNNKNIIEFSVDLLQRFSIDVVNIFENISHEEVFTKTYADFRGRYLAITEKENFVIIIDNNWILIRYNRPLQIKEYTLENSEIIFSMMNGDTAGIEMYYFFKNGEEIRHFSNHEGKIKEYGEPLEYEVGMEGSFSVLKNYAFDYNEFDFLNWNVFEVVDLLDYRSN